VLFKQRLVVASLVLMLDYTEQQWVTMLQYEHRIQLVITKTKQHTSIIANNVDNKKTINIQSEFFLTKYFSNFALSSCEYNH